MNPQFFHTQMARLRETFGPKALSAGREALVLRTVQGLPEKSFERIITHFVQSARYAPLPKDIVDAVIKERQHIGYPREVQPAAPIKCKWCADGGIMEIEGKNSGREYFIRCGCDEGRDSFRAGDLPQWSRELGEHFRAHEMNGTRATRWKPAGKFDPEHATASLKDKVDEWRLKMEVSRIYWLEYFATGDEPA